MITFDELGAINAAAAPVHMSQYSTNELREWAKLTESNLPPVARTSISVVSN